MGMYNGAAAMENSVAGPQKIKPSDPLLGIHTQELKLGTLPDICIPVFIGVLFPITKGREQPSVHQKTNG